MKLATYQIENTTVAVYNSPLGKESVKVNGQLVSEKFSFWGTEHYFTIGTDHYSVRPYLNFRSSCGMGVKVHKNGRPLDVEATYEKKNPWKVVLLIGLALVLGFAFGYGLTSLIVN
jgi:hypothetical protein